MLEPLAILSYLMAKPFGSDTSPERMTLRVAHSRSHHALPRRYTCQSHEAVPPALSWRGAPKDTVSFALLMINEDAPRFKAYQWALYNIPGDTHTLSDKHPAQAAYNSWGQATYHTPCPQKKHKKEHYRFELYALDTQFDTKKVLTAQELRKRLDAHTLRTANTYRYVSGAHYGEH